MPRSSSPRAVGPRVVHVRRAETCCVCHGPIAAGEQARLDPVAAAHTCVLCIDDPLDAPGGWPGRPPGADAGSIGRRSLAHELDALAPAGVLALHDRCAPETGAPIDHLVVTPNGIWVLDARRVAGPVRWRAVRAELRTRLLVNQRDETAALLRLDRHRRDVSRALLEHDLPDVRVRGALCFVDTEVRLLQRPLEIDGRLVTWSRALRRPLLRAGPLDEHLRADLHRILATSFPPAR